MSLLLSEGHTEARRYTLAMVWSEARIVRQRNHLRRLRDTAVTQLAIGSLFSKEAGKEVPKTLNKVNESD